jgi:Tol biopolymer transport system component
LRPRRTPVVARLLVGAALVVAGFTLVIACGGDDETTGLDLAFVSTRDGDYAIYRMSGDGKGERRVTDHAADSSTPESLFFQVEPAWSPDGTKIAFSSRRSGSYDVYVMNADGTGTRRLTSGRADDSHPTWSPDGQQVAFARSGDIVVVNADGSSARSIVASGAEESEPAWSPDGKWIAYVRHVPGAAVREVWLIRPDGSGGRQLTRQSAAVYTPAWSPDSARIVFTSNRDGEVFELYTIGVDGKGLRSVAPTAGDMFEPSWSPDGSKIAYSEDGAIFTVELGGGDVEQLTSDENNDSSPAWNPEPPPADE